MADTNNVSYLPNSKRMKTLVDSMLKDGMQNPLVVRRIEGSDSYLVIDGNHRLFILKDWGWKEIPCVISLSTVGRR
jgi:ParB-like chromosome segregation protein Spo0J